MDPTCSLCAHLIKPLKLKSFPWKRTQFWKTSKVSEFGEISDISMGEDLNLAVQ